MPVKDAQKVHCPSEGLAFLSIKRYQSRLNEESQQQQNRTTISWNCENKTEIAAIRQ